MPVFHDRADYLAWGRAHRFHHRVARPAFADQAQAAVAAAMAERHSVLPFGMGRSYGDVCLNDGQCLVDTRALDRFLAFDPDTGLLEAEAGVTLAAILHLLARPRPGRRRWFLPVTPGTRFVTIGGAIANDVHGKNHATAGSFGRHVRSLRLLRSDGSVRDLGAQDPLFAATIGGMGLTGLILSAQIQLKEIPGPWLEAEHIRYRDLDTFFALAQESEPAWEYTVAWIDCLAGGAQVGRGIFSRARHTGETPPGRSLPPLGAEPRLSMPLDLPGFTLNRWSIAAFNALYWRRAPWRPERGLYPVDPVFYPLDAIGQWNRMYGRRGFFQYQCAIPTANARDAVRALLQTIAAAGEGSFLAVLKTLGDGPAPGLMSFPLAGATLALDFPNTGPRTLALLDRLDRITAEAGGRLYPAKDGRVSAATFQRGYPGWRDFAAHIDPAFSSSFWRRVGADLAQRGSP